MLDSLFNPRSVAVIGASNDPNKVGFALINNLKRFNFKGAIFPINPRPDEILGLKREQKKVVKTREIMEKEFDFHRFLKELKLGK